MTSIFIMLSLLLFFAAPAQAYFMVTAPNTAEFLGYTELIFLDDGTFLRADPSYCCQTEMQSLPVLGPNGLLYQIDHPWFDNVLTPNAPERILRKTQDGTIVDEFHTIPPPSPFGTYRNLATVDGKLYLLGLVAGGVHQIDWETGEELGGSFNPLQGFPQSDMNGMTAGPDGKLYFTGFLGSAIYSWDPRTDVWGVLNPGFGGGLAPPGLENYTQLWQGIRYVPGAPGWLVIALSVGACATRGVRNKKVLKEPGRPARLEVSGSHPAGQGRA